jgi:hypothetical protein
MKIGKKKKREKTTLIKMMYLKKDSLYKIDKKNVKRKRKTTS